MNKLYDLDVNEEKKLIKDVSYRIKLRIQNNYNHKNHNISLKYGLIWVSDEFERFVYMKYYILIK